MTDETHLPRRTILQTAAAAAAAQLLASSPAQAATAAKAATGKAGDFDFLAGEWRIRHRRLKTPGGADWDLFEGEATCWSILGGVASIEELRIPARNFAGMGVRVLDAEKRIWSDHWVNARVGVLGTPGLTGVFENGVGTFTADDKDGDQPTPSRLPRRRPNLGRKLVDGLDPRVNSIDTRTTACFPPPL